MKITVEDFFTPIKLPEGAPERDYHIVQPFIQFAQSISQITYQSIYLIDYYKKGFAYVSDNPIFLCGMSPAAVLEAGYSYYLRTVPQADLELLLKINKAGFEFYNKIPVEDRLNYSISYDFHLTQSNGHLLLINHKLTPLILNKNGNMWIALCVVSLSSNKTAGNIILKRKGENKIFEYDVAAEKWKERSIIKLNRHEKQILALSSRGLTMKAIARELFLSVDTIKFHKRNIFRKLNVKNISEAISAAANLNIIY
jgi:DNA-binding CsgD family transcriptional regulator